MMNKTQAQRPMTLKQTRAQLRQHGMVLRKVDGEYQVKTSGEAWDSPTVYHTNDLADALRTGEIIAVGESMAADFRSAV
jgi:hypothetical protein